MTLEPNTPVTWPRSAVAAAIVTAGLCLSAATVWHASTAAFNATTTSGSNSWTTGTVALADDDAGAAMFSATGMVPGSTGTRCITVTYGGDVASTVRLYGSSPSTTNALASSINLTVEEGTGGSFASCTGFTPSSAIYTGTVDGFATTKTAFASGIGSFAPDTVGQSMVYRFTWTLDAATPGSAMGGTAALGFVWESQA